MCLTPQFLNYSPSHLTISDKGTSVHVRVVDSIALTWAYKRAPFLQNPKLQQSIVSAEMPGPISDLRSYGFLEFWFLGFSVASKTPKIRNSKSPKSVMVSRRKYWIFGFAINFAFCGCGMRFLGLVRITRAHYEGILIYTRPCPMCCS